MWVWWHGHFGTFFSCCFPFSKPMGNPELIASGKGCSWSESRNNQWALFVSASGGGGLELRVLEMTWRQHVWEKQGSKGHHFFHSLPRIGYSVGWGRRQWELREWRVQEPNALLSRQCPWGGSNTPKRKCLLTESQHGSPSPLKFSLSLSDVATHPYKAPTLKDHDAGQMLPQGKPTWAGGWGPESSPLPQFTGQGSCKSL